MNSEIPYLNEWIELSQSGKFEKAQEIYFEKLFPAVIENFVEKYQAALPPKGILYSMLGYSPEPIILTAKALQPLKHIIFTTNNKIESVNYLQQFLNGEYEVVYLKDERFSTIYKALKEQLFIEPSTDITIDVTGGKKSMVASAAIFGKDYNCKILYVDFEDYMKELRKPKPGSEILNIVYDPEKDQPELNILKA